MTTAQRDYYEVLGIARDADEKTIKNAYRKLALKYHPDRNKDPGAEKRFKEAAEAYAVLSDPKKRDRYDTGGFESLAGLSHEDLFGGIDFGDIFRGHGFDFGPQGIFERLFGHRRHEGPAKGRNIEVPLEVSLERVFKGGEETVQVARYDTCPSCQGSGAKPGTEPKKCGVCGGTGKDVKSQRKKGMLFQQITTCQTCGGRGAVIEKPCPKCEGLGQVKKEETLTVKVPVGIDEGTVLRVPGHGQPSPGPGGTPGDLFVLVQTKPDPRFERRGPHLWSRPTIEIADAVLGTSLDVPTLDGDAQVTVPPGTQPDAVLRLPDKGLPRLRGGARGDLYLAVNVHIPTKLTEDQRKLFERLRELDHKD